MDGKTNNEYHRQAHVEYASGSFGVSGGYTKDVRNLVDANGKTKKKEHDVSSFARAFEVYPNAKEDCQNE